MRFGNGSTSLVTSMAVQMNQTEGVPGTSVCPRVGDAAWDHALSGLGSEFAASYAYEGENDQ